MSSPILGLGIAYFNSSRHVVAYSVSNLMLRACQELAGSVPYPQVNLQVDKIVLTILVGFLTKLLMHCCSWLLFMHNVVHLRY